MRQKSMSEEAIAEELDMKPIEVEEILKGKI